MLQGSSHEGCREGARVVVRAAWEAEGQLVEGREGEGDEGGGGG